MEHCHPEIDQMDDGGEQAATYIERRNMTSPEVYIGICSIPHHCDIPGCPGGENQRKLKLFKELVEACEETAQCMTHQDQVGQVQAANRILAILAKVKEEQHG